MHLIGSVCSDWFGLLSLKEYDLQINDVLKTYGKMVFTANVLLSTAISSLVYDYSRRYYYALFSSLNRVILYLKSKKFYYFQNEHFLLTVNKYWDLFKKIAQQKL